MFSRIVSNIINNAIEATSDDKSFVEVELDRNEKYLIVKVKDQGPGISKDEEVKAFERGYTTKSSGSGLGLSHAKEIIEKNGGNIQFEKNNGFLIKLYFRFENEEAI